MKISALIIFALAIAYTASATPGARPTKLAAPTIAQEDAQAVALADVPGGTVQSAELERESGELVWSFDKYRSLTAP